MEQKVNLSGSGSPPFPMLSVVVPCYNEANRLANSIQTLLSYLGGQALSFEVILVDDGSNDQTLAIMNQLRSIETRVKIVKLLQNSGKGRALMEGVRVSTGSLVLLTDADFSAPITELSKLIVALENGADIAIASRAMELSDVVPQPFYRVFMGKTFNLIVRWLLLPGIKDTQCGFKLIRGPLARDIFARLLITGFAYDVEMLCLAKADGAILVEIPVRWVNSPQSRVSPVKHSIQMLLDILRLWIRVRRKSGRSMKQKEKKR